MAKVDYAKYRPSPFWFLNHELTVYEIAWQVDKLAEMGPCGAVLHSRHGLKTPYLSDEWFILLEEALCRGQRHGIVFWLYDEYNWPSDPASMKTWEGYP